MTWHPAEDDLVLYCYGETLPADPIEIEAHLAACAVCRLACDEIRETLRAADAVEVPDPGVGFEQRLWRHVSMAAPHGAVAPASFGRLLPAGAWALTALVASAASALWLYPTGHAGTSDGQSAIGSTDVQERVLLTALDDHFTRTELLLVELLNAPVEAAPRLDFERTVADDLVASGRLYRQTARQTGQAQVTAVLDDLEAVLIEVARGPERLEPTELDLLRLQIDEHGLLFKVRAVGDRIRGQRDTRTPLRRRDTIAPLAQERVRTR